MNSASSVPPGGGYPRGGRPPGIPPHTGGLPAPPSPLAPSAPLVLPLFPGISRGTEDRRTMLRAAVVQVVQHLVERAVPPAQRDPLFGQAMDLLDEAGWGLDELAEAAGPGPAQDELLRTLGLLSP
jgi:hypothetical protein